MLIFLADASLHLQLTGERSMYCVYRTDHIPGTGIAILIVSQATQSGSRFAEHYILLPHAESCKRMARRYSIEMSEQIFSSEELRNYVCEYAKNELQNYVDEQSLKQRSTFRSLVRLNDADDAVLRALKLAGLCEAQLNRIATQTYCDELKAAIRKLSRLPVISTNPID